MQLTHSFSGVLIFLFLNEFVYLDIGGSLGTVSSVYCQIKQHNIPREHCVATKLVLVQVWQGCDTEEALDTAKQN